MILILSNEIKAQKKDFEVDCIEVLEKNTEFPNNDDIIIKTCFIKKYIFKSIGTPDYKGRYSNYVYQLFKIENNDTLKISNSKFFNKNSKKLEKIINQKLKAEYESNLKIPEIQECMNYVDFRYFDLNEFGITFDHKKQIEFHIEYYAISACLNVGGSIITLPFDKVKEYLK